MLTSATRAGLFGHCWRNLAVFEHVCYDRFHHRGQYDSSGFKRVNHPSAFKSLTYPTTLLKHPSSNKSGSWDIEGKIWGPNGVTSADKCQICLRSPTKCFSFNAIFLHLQFQSFRYILPNVPCFKIGWILLRKITSGSSTLPNLGNRPADSFGLMHFDPKYFVQV